jgi:hypothetical protein
MFIPDPGSRIPDPGSKNSNKRERWKKICCHTFLCSHKFHKIVNYFSFEVLKKKIWANFQWLIELFTKKIVKKLLKIWSWDPGFGIRDPGSGKKPIPDPGSRGQKAPDPGSGSATLLQLCKRCLCETTFIESGSEPRHFALWLWPLNDNIYTWKK